MAGCDLRRKEGFSLIEVLVALTILAVGLLALAVLQVTAIKGNAVASKWTVATEQAQDRLERFRHISWDNIVSSSPSGLDNSSGTTVPNYSNFPSAAGDNTNVRGTLFYRVWSVSSNATNTFKTITVWSCWQDESRRWHNVMLVMQRSNIGGM